MRPGGDDGWSKLFVRDFGARAMKWLQLFPNGAGGRSSWARDRDLGSFLPFLINTGVTELSHCPLTSVVEIAVTRK